MQYPSTCAAGAWLASASSSNKEFSLRARDGFSTPSYEALAKQAQTVTFAGKKTLLGVSGSPTHWHQPLKRGNQELLVLNGGYPVNLTGGPDTIAPLYAQLIRSMMLLASRQARDLPRGTKGLVALERDGQRQLAQRFMAIVRKLRPPPPAPVRALLEAAYKQTLADLAR